MSPMKSQIALTLVELREHRHRIDEAISLLEEISGAQDGLPRSAPPPTPPPALPARPRRPRRPAPAAQPEPAAQPKPGRRQARVRQLLLAARRQDRLPEPFSNAQVRSHLAERGLELSGDHVAQAMYLCHRQGLVVRAEPEGKSPRWCWPKAPSPKVDGARMLADIHAEIAHQKGHE